MKPIIGQTAAPSRLQVALAASIVRTKPEAITIRDYLRQLRAHLQPLASQNGRQLHGAAFWKELYKLAEQRCCDLERRNSQLQRANDTRQSRVNVESLLDNSCGSSEQQGFAMPAMPNPSTSSSQWAEASPAPKPSASGAHNTVARDFPALEVLDERGYAHGPIIVADENTAARARLARNIFTAHTLYRQIDPDSEAVCRSVIRTAQAIGSVIATLFKDHEQLVAHKSIYLDDPSSELFHVLKGSGKAFSFVLVALDKFNHVLGRRHRSCIVYECVNVFRAILNSITESSSVVATYHSPPTGDEGRSRATSSLGQDGPTQTLVKFFNFLITYLERTNASHREIFEGAFFILMERVGKRLFHFTFGHDRSATIEGDIIQSYHYHHAEPIGPEQVEDTCDRLEAQSLVSVLERMVAAAPRYMNPLPVSSCSSNGRKRPQALSPNTLPTSHKVSLCAQARNRLQRTLIGCVFGKEGRDDFLDALKMPAQLGGVPDIPHGEDQNLDEWFQQEIWTLIGWDLLGRDDCD